MVFLLSNDGHPFRGRSNKCLGLLGLFAWIMAFSPAIQASEGPRDICEALISGMVSPQYRDLLTRKRLVGSVVVESFNLNDMMASPNFGRYLDAQAKAPAGEQNTASWQHINGYLEWLARFYSSENLLKLQDQALLSALVEHGHSMTPVSENLTTGREALTSLSKNNLTVLLGGEPTELQGLSPETPGKLGSAESLRRLRAAIAQLGFRFVHNTDVRFQSEVNFPLLSSYQLVRSGLGGGRNTGIFNHDFLKSDDSVFFYIEVIRESPAVPAQNKRGFWNWLTNGFRTNGSESSVQHTSPGEFGKHSISVSPPYAKAHGLVSFFVMRPQDLLTFAEVFAPDLYPAMINSFTEVREQPNRLPLVWHEAKLRLHRMDFTVEDALTLVKQKIQNEMLQLWMTDRPAFHAHLNALELGDARQLHNAIRILVWEPAGLGTDEVRTKHYAPLELKIPVGVPSEAVLSGLDAR